MKRNILSIGLLLLALMTVACTGEGLSDQDLADMALITDAFNNLAAQQSASMTFESQIDQDMEVMGMNVQNVMIMRGEGVAQFSGGRISGVDLLLTSDTTMDMGALGGTTSGSSQTQVIIINGRFFTRVFNTTGALAGNDTDWVDASMAPPGSITAEQIFGALGGDQLLPYPLNESTVRRFERIGALPGEGQTIHGYRVVLDMSAVLREMDIEAAMAQFNLTELSTLGLDVAQMMTDIFEGSEVEVRIWIGADDRLVHLLELDTIMNVDVRIQGISMRIDQDMTQRQRFTAFNVPAAITAPR
ncbi:MAG: hypothetical protein ACOCYT_00015 [Chloroflexota bacterium]